MISVHGFAEAAYRAVAVGADSKAVKVSTQRIIPNAQSKFCNWCSSWPVWYFGHKVFWKKCKEKTRNHWLYMVYCFTLLPLLYVTTITLPLRFCLRKLRTTVRSAGELHATSECLEAPTIFLYSLNFLFHNGGTLFWDVTRRMLVVSYRRFGTTWRSIFKDDLVLEDGIR